MRGISNFQFPISKRVLLVLVAGLLAAGCNSNPQSSNQQTVAEVQSTPAPTPTPTPTISPTVTAKSVPTAKATPTVANTPTPTPTPSVTSTVSQVTNYVTYQGQDGKTALELLQTKYKVGVQVYSGIGDFVTSINGVTPDSKHFWEFFVNGKSSNVGASSYVTKSSDMIEWKLSLIGANGD